MLFHLWGKGAQFLYKKKITWFLYLSYRKKHKEINVFLIANKIFCVRFCKSWCFYDHVMNNSSVHMTRNYVFMAIKTHTKPNKLNTKKSYVCIISKNLTKMDICLERMLSFYTLNGHILLVKLDFETCRSLTKVLSWAHARVSEAKIMCNHNVHMMRNYVFMAMKTH